MISAGRASRFRIRGRIVFLGSEGTDETASAVASDFLTLGTERVEDKDVEGDLRSPMIVSILF